MAKDKRSSGGSRRHLRHLVSGALLGVPLAYTLAVSGAPPAAAPPAAGTAKPPGADAANPAATTNRASPSAPGGARPVSGGGDAPHGAMTMQKQQAIFDKIAKPLPANGGAPGGIEPSYWKAIVPAD